MKKLNDIKITIMNITDKILRMGTRQDDIEEKIFDQADYYHRDMEDDEKRRKLREEALKALSEDER